MIFVLFVMPSILSKPFGASSFRLESLDAGLLAPLAFREFRIAVCRGPNAKLLYAAEGFDRPRQVQGYAHRPASRRGHRARLADGPSARPVGTSAHERRR